MLPDADSDGIPAPRARGYVYDSLLYVFLDVPYPPAIRAAAEAGTLAPTDFTDANPSWAWAAGGFVSTAADLVTWIEALVGGQLLDDAYQRVWRESLQPTDPNAPNGLQYGYGIAQVRLGSNRIFFHNGEPARLQHVRRLRSGQPGDDRDLGEPTGVRRQSDACGHARRSGGHDHLPDVQTTAPTSPET